MSVETLLNSIPAGLTYLVVGLVVGVESLGIPVPGEIVLVAAALMTTGPVAPLNPHAVALAVVTGAVVGDSIGYLVGSRYGDRLFDWLGRHFPRHVNDDTLSYARHLFARHGVWAVFLGRFVALLRIFAGPLAGSLTMRYPAFLAANALGAVVWGAGTVYGVHLLGAVVEKWMKDFSFVGLIVAVLAGLALSTVLRRRVRAAVERHAEWRREHGERSHA